MLCLVDKTVARKACVHCVWLPRNWQSETVLYSVAKKVGGNECVCAHTRVFGCQGRSRKCVHAVLGYHESWEMKDRKRN